MVSDVRLTAPVVRVLAALLADPDGDHYGLELMRESGLASGTLYPILARLTEAGWLEKRWEELDPVAAGRPARAYYRLTRQALPLARQRLAELHEQTRGAAGRVSVRSTREARA
ncbi:MAG TPA: helix-turn-helix transcriptional regulator [Candidatus Limnocylindrales bacterium]|nr:helix-turn-helix transcriptional regulator [Candidatus Limnocylindrales bacterium]